MCATAALGDGAIFWPDANDQRDTVLAQLFCDMASAKKDDVWTQFRPISPAEGNLGNYPWSPA